jgi:hypothetical protein
MPRPCTVVMPPIRLSFSAAGLLVKLRHELHSGEGVTLDKRAWKCSPGMLALRQVRGRQHCSTTDSRGNLSCEYFVRMLLMKDPHVTGMVGMCLPGRLRGRCTHVCTTICKIFNKPVRRPSCHATTIKHVMMLCVQTTRDALRTLPCAGLPCSYPVALTWDDSHKTC